MAATNAPVLVSPPAPPLSIVSVHFVEAQPDPMRRALVSGVTNRSVKASDEVTLEKTVIGVMVKGPDRVYEVPYASIVRIEYKLL